MHEFLIRKARLDDAAFLADAIIAAEKSGTDKLGLATLFDLTESEVRSAICAMLEEEIDECEFSISSFLIAEHNGDNVAAVGGWVEGFNQKIASRILKANLISFCIPRENILSAHSKSASLAGVAIERENLSLQIEYVYVDKTQRGKSLTESLINQHIANALLAYPQLKKIQVQVFSNNIPAIKAYEKCGFKIAGTFKSDNNDILQSLPHNEKYLMDINL